MHEFPLANHRRTKPTQQPKTSKDGLCQMHLRRLDSHARLSQLQRCQRQHDINHHLWRHREIPTPSLLHRTRPDHRPAHLPTASLKPFHSLSRLIPTSLAHRDAAATGSWIVSAAMGDGEPDDLWQAGTYRVVAVEHF
jgi:hypothetical protein